MSHWSTPWLEALLGDAELEALFSEEAELAALLRFESALAQAESIHGLVPEAAAARIVEVCTSFKADSTELSKAMAIDGVVVPELVRQLRAAVGADAAPFLHLGATSQDVIDTGLVLRLCTVFRVFENRLQHIVEALDALLVRFGTNTLMARTRMQSARPVRVADRLAIWRDPLVVLREEFREQRPRLLRVQLGGPVGTRDGLEQGDSVANTLAEILGLYPATPCWHTTRHSIVNFADTLSHLTGAFGKLGQDIALMAQTGIETVSLKGTGSSSAMEHKRNPVKAEVLVSLARYNAVQVSAMHQALLHEQERSGAAWTLEWLVLPAMVQVTGSSSLLTRELLDSIEWIGEQ